MSTGGAWCWSQGSGTRLIGQFQKRIREVRQWYDHALHYSNVLTEGPASAQFSAGEGAHDIPSCFTAAPSELLCSAEQSSSADVASEALRLYVVVWAVYIPAVDEVSGGGDSALFLVLSAVPALDTVSFLRIPWLLPLRDRTVSRNGRNRE